jgi:hypothetical protein
MVNHCALMELLCDPLVNKDVHDNARAARARAVCYPTGSIHVPSSGKLGNPNRRVGTNLSVSPHSVLYAAIAFLCNQRSILYIKSTLLRKKLFCLYAAVDAGAATRLTARQWYIARKSTLAQKAAICAAAVDFLYSQITWIHIRWTTNFAGAAWRQVLEDETLIALAVPCSIKILTSS